jgi:hypothetical protein
MEQGSIPWYLDDNGITISLQPGVSLVSAMFGNYFKIVTVAIL